LDDAFRGMTPVKPWLRSWAQRGNAQEFSTGLGKGKFQTILRTSEHFPKRVSNCVNFRTNMFRNLPKRCSEHMGDDRWAARRSFLPVAHNRLPFGPETSPFPPGPLRTRQKTMRCPCPPGVRPVSTARTTPDTTTPPCRIARPHHEGRRQRASPLKIQTCRVKHLPLTRTSSR